MNTDERITYNCKLAWLEERQQKTAITEPVLLAKGETIALYSAHHSSPYRHSDKAFHQEPHSR